MARLYKRNVSDRVTLLPGTDRAQVHLMFSSSLVEISQKFDPREIPCR